MLTSITKESHIHELMFLVSPWWVFFLFVCFFPLLKTHALIPLWFQMLKANRNCSQLVPHLLLGALFPLRELDGVRWANWTWHLGLGHFGTRSSCEWRPPVKPLSASELFWNAARAFGSNSYSMGKGCNVCMMFRWSSNISSACHAMSHDWSAGTAVKWAKVLDRLCLR